MVEGLVSLCSGWIGELQWFKGLESLGVAILVSISGGYIGESKWKIEW